MLWRRLALRGTRNGNEDETSEALQPRNYGRLASKGNNNGDGTGSRPSTHCLPQSVSYQWHVISSSDSAAVAFCCCCCCQTTLYWLTELDVEVTLWGVPRRVIVICTSSTNGKFFPPVYAFGRAHWSIESSFGQLAHLESCFAAMCLERCHDECKIPELGLQPVFGTEEAEFKNEIIWPYIFLRVFR